MITTVNELGSVLSQVTPTAAAMNVSFEQVGAALANLTAQGTPTAQATTQLNQLFAELGKSGTTGQKALTEAAKGSEYAGKSFQQLMKEGVPLNKIIDLMSDYANKNNLSMIDMFSSIEAGKAALSVTGKNSEQFTTNLKAMKTETDVVGDAYNKVTDTFQEKSKKVVNSLKNVGISAYEKFQQPLKGAMDSAQGAVDGLTRNMSSGKLGKSVDKIADGFASLIKVAVDLASKAIPVVVDSFAFLIDHGKQVIAVTAGLAAGIIYFKNQQLINNAIMLISKGIQTAWAVVSYAAAAAVESHSVAIGLQTLATKALNVVQLASPQGLLTAAIIAGTAAIAAYVAFLYSSREETDENIISTNKLADEYNELSETLEDNKKSREEVVESVEDETAGADVLLRKLDELSNKENKSNYEKQQMKYYVDELNKIMPDLNLSYNEEKDALNKSTDAIKSNIEQQKALNKVKAYQKNLTQIAEDMANAEMKLDEATVQHTKNEKALDEAKKKRLELDEKIKKQNGTASKEQQQAYQNACIAEGKLQENYNKSKKVVDGLQSELKGLNSEYDKTDKFAQKQSDTANIEKKLTEYTEIAKKKGFEIPQKISESIKKGSYKVPASFEEMQSLINYDEMIRKANINGLEIPKRVADGIKDGSLKPSQAMKQVNALMTFDDLMYQSSVAGREVPEVLKNNILDGKLKPKEAIDQMKRFVTFEDMLSESVAMGEQVPEEIKNKILEGKMKPADAVQIMIDNMNFTRMLSDAGIEAEKVPTEIRDKILEGKMKPAEAMEQVNRYLDFKELLEAAGRAGEAIPDTIKGKILEGSLEPQDGVDLMKNATTFDEMVEKAGLAGEKIPEELRQKILDGQLEPSNALESVKSKAFEKCDDLVKKATEAGIAIPEELKKQIENREGRPAEAITKLQNRIDFKNAIEKAKIAGELIPETIRQKVYEGQMKPQDAVDQIQRSISFDKAINSAALAGHAIPEDIKQKVLEGALKPADAVKQMQRLIEFNEILATTNAAGKEIPEDLRQKILEGKMNPVNAVSEMTGLAVGELKKAKTQMQQAGEYVAKGAADGIISGATKYYKPAVEGMAESGALRFTSYNEVKSPSRLYKRIAAFIPEGAAKGIEENAHLVADATGDMAEGMLDEFGNVLEIHSPSKAFEKLAKQVPAGIVNGVKAGTNQAVDSISVLGKKLELQARANGSYDFTSIGKNLVNKFASGISSSTGDAVSKVSNMVNSSVASLAKANPKAKDEFSKAGKAVIDAYSDSIKAQTEKLNKTVTEAIDKAASTAQSKYDELIRKRDSLASVMKNSDKLLATKDDKTTLTDLSASKKEIDDYGRNLDALKKIVPEDLMEEILGMSFDDGKAYTDSLRKMNKKDLDAYVKTWNDRQKSIKDISDRYYSSQIQDVKKTFNDSVSKIFADNNSDMKNVGVNAMKGLISGMSSKSKDLSGTSKSLANSIIKEFKSVLKIKSPSKVFEKLGGYVPEGAEKGIKNASNKPVDSIRKMSKDVISAFHSVDLSRLLAPVKEAVMAEQMKMTSVVQSSANIEIMRDSARFGEQKASANSYTTNVTINSPKELKPSEIGLEMNNLQRRLAWNNK